MGIRGFVDFGIIYFPKAFSTWKYFKNSELSFLAETHIRIFEIKEIPIKIEIICNQWQILIVK